MVEAEENGEIRHITTRTNSFPGDLLQKFMNGNYFPGKMEETSRDEEEDIELSLGLSLNGRFGVDPKRANKLIRSSSVSNFVGNDGNTAFSSPFAAYTPLTRTSSLPTETGEEWRMRKELQSLRRMGAKRKRSEKLKNVRIVRDKIDWEENCEEDGQRLVHINGNGEFSTAFGMATWVSRAVGGAVNGLGIESKGKRCNDLGGGGGGLQGLPPAPPQSARLESVESQGSGSSSICDFECQTTQGTSKYNEIRSPASVHHQQGQLEQKPLVCPGTTNERPAKFAGAAPENQSAIVSGADKGGKETMRNMMVDMPCVFTKGDGPNGKRTEGFLYRYRKGEEVRIVCVCHGSFLSPAEFVKHAGGGDVAYPLKHIVVKPSPFL